MPADEARNENRIVKNQVFPVFYVGLENISAEVFEIFIFGMAIIEARKIILTFAHFRRGWIWALRKKLLEHFRVIFGILNNIFL